MPSETISLEFLAAQAKANMSEMRQIRKDIASLMRIVTATWEQSSRTDRRLNEMRDELNRRYTELREDLELMIKIEIGGSTAHLQTHMDNALSPIRDSLDDLNTRARALEDAR